MSESDFWLSGRTLPGYKAYAEYFRSANGNPEGFCVSLDEMGWLLGTGVLFKQDADKVMGFLGNITRELEGEFIKIAPVKNEYLPPILQIQGKKFPDAVANIDFYLFYHPSHISSTANALSRHSTFLDCERYAGTIELDAYKRAFDGLNTSLKHDKRLANLEKLNIDENFEEKFVRYEINSHLKYDSGLNESVNAIVACVEYVHKATTIAGNVSRQYKQRVSSLADALSNENMALK